MFYKKWIDRAKTTGAIAPTGIIMARKMASLVRPDSNLPVLELGPGNGIITKTILQRGIDPGKLVSVEYSENFLPDLRARYPGVNFVHGDALNITQITKERRIEKFDTIISALPLLNFSLVKRLRFLDRMLDLLEPGRPIIQFSYGPWAPIPVRDKHHSRPYVVTSVGIVLRNLPPARLWAYTRPLEVDRKPCVYCSKDFENLVRAA